MAYWVLAAFWVLGACLLAAFACSVFAIRDEGESLDEELAHWEAEREAQRAREHADNDWPRR